MLKKRLVLCLLLKGNFFANSRNFTLQSVVGLDAMLQYLNFDGVDELVVLNATKNEKDIPYLGEVIEKMSRKCFIPITAGGGVFGVDDFNVLLRSGADKVAINTVAHENLSVITESAKVFGSQCVVVSIDTKKNKEGFYEVYSNDGQKNTGKDPIEWAVEVEKLGAGEIFLTSIDKDGTGTGYDLELVREVSEAVSIPVIASGGVGELDHLVDGIVEGKASAVSVANVFHFMGYSLFKAKAYIASKRSDFPHTQWNF